MSQLENKVFLYISKKGYIEPEREFQFYKKRKWRFDFAWPDVLIALEIEGGNFGRHQRREGFAADCEKYNQAALLGWTVFRCTTEMVTNGYIEKLLEEILYPISSIIKK